jgi:hypothetical protein
MQQSAKLLDTGSNPVFASNIDRTDDLFGNIFTVVNHVPVRGIDRSIFIVIDGTREGIGMDTSLYLGSKMYDEIELGWLTG